MHVMHDGGGTNSEGQLRRYHTVRPRHSLGSWVDRQNLGPQAEQLRELANALRSAASDSGMDGEAGRAARELAAEIAKEAGELAEEFDEVTEIASDAVQVVHDGATEYDNLPDAGLNANQRQDRKSTRLNSSHVAISYAVFCLK